MGHDISVLSYHDLDTSSVEAVGKELAERFSVNVKCYYRDNYDLDLWLRNDFPTYDEHLLAEFETPGATVTWQLYDENYVQKQLYMKHGDKIKEHPLFVAEPNQLKEYLCEINEIQFKLYHKTDDNTDWLADIHGRLWECDFHYFSRWWSFCRCFMEFDGPECKESLNDFRGNLKSTIRKMGGNSAVYVDDQGESEGYIYDAYSRESWNDFVAEIKERFGEKCLHVSDFMKRNVYLKNDDYPNAFYDDYDDFE